MTAIEANEYTIHSIKKYVSYLTEKLIQVEINLTGYKEEVNKLLDPMATDLIKTFDLLKPLPQYKNWVIHIPRSTNPNHIGDYLRYLSFNLIKIELNLEALSEEDTYMKSEIINLMQSFGKSLDECHSYLPENWSDTEDESEKIRLKRTQELQK